MKDMAFTHAAKQPHQCDLGDVVEIDLDLHWPGIEDNIEVRLKGKCRLYVIAHEWDSDGTPIYMLSDIPVEYPKDSPVFSGPRLLYRSMAHVVEHGYGEQSVKRTGQHRDLFAKINDWLVASRVSEQSG